MKIKRLIALAAVFALSIAACIGTIALSASADTAATTYFSMSDGVTAEIADGGIVFTVKADGQSSDDEAKAEYTVTSVNKFYLPELKILGTANNVSLKIGGEAYDLANSPALKDVAEDIEPGVLELVLTLNDSSADGTLTISDMKYGDKSLFAIEGGDLKANDDAVYVDNDSLLFYELNSRANDKGTIVWGYNYSEIDYDVYHGFIKGDISKELLVFYGEQTDIEAAYADYVKFFTEENESSDSSSSADDKTIEEKLHDDHGVTLKRYSSLAATVKFTDNSDNTDIVLYYGHYNYGGYNELAINVVDELPETAPAYSDKLVNEFYAKAAEGEDPKGYDAYLNDIKEAYCENIGDNDEPDYQPKYIGSSTYFNIPEAIYDYIESPYFSTKDLTKVICYKLPNSTTFTTLSASSTKRFALTQLGTYEFYVLATDPQGNAFEIDEEWKLTYGKVNETYTKEYGYWEVDENDEPVELKVPVFRFTLANRGPQVTKGSSYQDPGYVGSSYTKVSSFTIRGNDYSSEYILWFKPVDNDTYANEFEGEGWYKISSEDDFYATAEALKLDWDEDDYKTLAWNSSSLSFTPIARGSYVVECIAHDSEAKMASDHTQIVTVRSEMVMVGPNKTMLWFERNWRSVLFLGIAFLSLVGIIALLFVKPKEENVEE